MIDIRCPCDKATYHADESQIGKSLQCTVCGRILRIEGQALGPTVPRQVEHVAVPVESSTSSPPITSNRRGLSRDTRIAVGIGTALIVLLLIVWIRLRPPESKSTTGPPAASQDESTSPAPPPHIPALSELKTIPKYLPEKPKLPLPTLILSPSPPLVLTPECAEGHNPERPATGMRIEPDEGSSGASTLRIMNGLDVDAAVRLVDTSTNRTSRFVYVRANDAYTIEEIEPGTYSLRYATGSDWIAACGEFQRDEEIEEFEESRAFQERVFDEGGYHHHTLTEAQASLNPVPQGNARTRKIDRRRFFQGDQHFSLAPGGP